MAQLIVFSILFILPALSTRSLSVFVQFYFYSCWFPRPLRAPIAANPPSSQQPAWFVGAAILFSFVSCGAYAVLLWSWVILSADHIWDFLHTFTHCFSYFMFSFCVFFLWFIVVAILRGPHVACPPFFLFTGFVSLSAVSLAENPFLIYFLCFSLLAVVTPRPPVPRGFHPAV
jgi:hypothetical protein